MKPDFALSLSLDGIRLMYRVQEGWHLLGDVPLEHADLDGALKDLRARGEAQGGGQALCKLILPDDQIKYLDLDAPDGDAEAFVRAALQDATPYAVDELAYDFVETGDRIQVAAVAQETLIEAEGFATTHGFQPLCFVAAPDEAVFQAEPFFGPTRAAADLIGDPNLLSPDDYSVEVTSEGDLPLPAAPADVEGIAETADDLETPEFPDAAHAIIDAEVISETGPDAEPVQENEEIEDADIVPPSFATSRNLVAERGAQAEGAKLPGAKRGLETSEFVATNDVVDASPMPESALSQQETRFDPATLIAGLKAVADPAPVAPKAPAPKPAKSPAAQIATKISESAPSGAAAAPQKPTPMGEVGAQRGKPKYLGILLTAILLLFLAGVAVWASIFTEDGISGWIGSGDDIEQIALLPEPNQDVELAILSPSSQDTITDSAEIEALDDKEGTIIDPVMDAALPIQTGEAFYAATGIWDRAPEQPLTPLGENTDNIYLASFEASQVTHDAIALPTAASFGEDLILKPQNNPVGPGIKITLDERGLVVATADGSISPEGIMVFKGKPTALPEAWPDRSVEVAAVETAVVEQEQAAFAGIRPQSRPNNLVEQNERATLGGSTLSELAKYRPRLRPERATQIASVNTSAIDDALENAVDSASDLAIAASLKPRARPAGFAKTVAASQERQASVAVPRNETVTPQIPTTASVARSATEKNVINLRKVNLIGVYGSASNRRALVRLSSGRYKKVKVGDRIDGGKVAAIGSAELRYVKGKRDVVLKMPKG